MSDKNIKIFLYWKISMKMTSFEWKDIVFSSLWYLWKHLDEHLPYEMLTGLVFYHSNK